MPITTALTQRFDLAHPIIQAPLAGGGDTPALVAAVSEARALGFIGAAYLTPAQITEASQQVRARTKRPFGINLFAPMPLPRAPQNPGPALARAAPFFAELGLPPPTLPAPAAQGFDAQFAAVLESGAAIFSFTFGLLPAGVLDAARGRGMFLMGTATTVEEAIALEQSGVDAVVVQGSEAGGHRGTFAGDFAQAMIGTMALVPQSRCR
jgi:nitronate monooxygenase